MPNFRSCHSSNFSCTQSHSPETNTDPAGVLTQEEEVKNTLINMWDAIEKEDIERYASYIHPDFMLVPLG
ncbi:unnamed protein product [marine sediment metagenome]|uniref:Uncharacterized protein n=1 Tax=marine sediment metagenome TaxID=412755 RepID=X1AAZ6_9ZZZZ